MSLIQQVICSLVVTLSGKAKHVLNKPVVTSISSTVDVFISGSWGVRLTKELIPSHAIKGDDVTLECDYDLQGDSLYSVKWYRNDQEFYRHIPTDRPQTVVFNQPGLIVDVSMIMLGH